MGLNLLLLDQAGRAHPQWDDGKFFGDAEFARSLATLPVDRAGERLRPSDFSAWREEADRINRFANEGRLRLLIDLLEADQCYALVICR